MYPNKADKIIGCKISDSTKNPKTELQALNTANISGLEGTTD